MKKFINTIKKKDRKLSKYLEKKELDKLEKVFYDLEGQHQEIKNHLKEVNYLLDLIEKHKIEALKDPGNQNKTKKRGSWLTKLKTSFEKLHLLHTDKLTSEDIEFLQNEKSKLLFEKEQLEKEEHHILSLIAKAKTYMMNVRNIVCKEITKGNDIAAVGENLLEHFGKKIDEGNNYDSGRKIMMNFFEEHFTIDRIKARELVDLLEKSKVISYSPDFSNLISIPDYSNFSEFTNLNYMPLYGIWYINA